MTEPNPTRPGSTSEEEARRDVEWTLPGSRPTPAQARARTGVVCAGTPELFNGVFVVAATHRQVSREILAMAVKQFRPDVADLERDDVAALITAIWNGGRQGFDAVLRSRRRGERKSMPLPWAGP
jgi:hypothetical protein